MSMYHTAYRKFNTKVACYEFLQGYYPEIRIEKRAATLAELQAICFATIRRHEAGQETDTINRIADLFEGAGY